MSRREAGEGAQIHAEDSESHAKEFGHYYKHRGDAEELPLRDEITQTAPEVKHSACGLKASLSEDSYSQSGTMFQGPVREGRSRQLRDKMF